MRLSEQQTQASGPVLLHEGFSADVTEHFLSRAREDGGWVTLGSSWAGEAGDAGSEGGVALKVWTTALTRQETVHFGRSAAQLDRCHETGALRRPGQGAWGDTPARDAGATRASQKHKGLGQAGLVLMVACTQRATRTLVSCSHTLQGGSLGWGWGPQRGSGVGGGELGQSEA